MPRWSELTNDHRTLRTEVVVDLFSKESTYKLLGETAELQMMQTYTAKVPKKPTRLSWELWLPSSELMAEHSGAEFRVVFHFGKGVCESEGHLFPPIGTTASILGRAEIEGLFEAGLCVPELQNQS